MCRTCSVARVEQGAGAGDAPNRMSRRRKDIEGHVQGTVCTIIWDDDL